MNFTPHTTAAQRFPVTYWKPLTHMPRGSKSSYTSKQKRQAEHIEEGYEKRGVKKKTAEARAWATVNKMTGGGKKSGSGRGKAVDKSPAKKGGKLGGKAKKATAKSRSKTTKSRSSSKSTATKRKAPAKRKVTSRAKTKKASRKK